MKKGRPDRLFAPSNSLTVLSFLADSPGRRFLSSEVQKGASLSRAGTYLALRELVRQGLASREEKGKFHLYSVAHDNPLVKQYKILTNIVRLEPILARLRPISLKIVLFGSASRGEDAASSDIDLFILTGDPETAGRILASFSSERKIQPIGLAPAEWADFENKERAFCLEIDRGIILWERTDEPGLRRVREEGNDPAVFPGKSTGVQRARKLRVRLPQG
jgi:predicted nucleotidyltransferase